MASSSSPTPTACSPKLTLRQKRLQTPLSDKRKTLVDLPQEVLDELLYVYVHGLTTDPPLIESIGPFLDEYPSLYPDQVTKTRLRKKVSDWDRSRVSRNPPSEQQAPRAAAFVKHLKQLHWSKHRRDDSMSDDDSEFGIDSPPPTPEKLANPNKKKTPPAASRPFQPDPATFKIMADPPIETVPGYGFSLAELGVNYDTVFKCNHIVAIDPRDPTTLPDGYLAWEDKGVKVNVKGTEILKDRVAILVQVTSPESANEVTMAKLEKNGQGLVLLTCAQDPNFVKSFDEVKDEVADKAGQTIDDPSGVRFADRVSIVPCGFWTFPFHSYINICYSFSCKLLRPLSWTQSMPSTRQEPFKVLPTFSQSPRPSSCFLRTTPSTTNTSMT